MRAISRALTAHSGLLTPLHLYTRSLFQSHLSPPSCTWFTSDGARRRSSTSIPCKESESEGLLLPNMDAKQLRVGFIGAGMMASALINGVIAAKMAKPENIMASDIYQPSLDRLSALGVQTTKSNQDVCKFGADVVIFAVKPDVLPSVLKSCVVENALVVSIAGGVPLSTIEPYLAPSARAIRVMPNTPCLVLESASAFAAGGTATEADKALVQELLGSVGFACEVKEKQMDAVTGLSGSGPAYVFMMIEAMADGAVRMGLPRALALKLAAQTAKGAAAMVLETGKHPGELKDQVCSPGGMTIAAVEALEDRGFRGAAMAAVVASAKQSAEGTKAAKAAQSGGEGK